MAVFVYKNASLVIGSATLSDHVIEATLRRGVHTPDGTAMGATTEVVMAGGLRTEELTVLFFQDHASGSVDDTLNSLMTTAATVTLKPTGSGPDANNPSYACSMICADYDPASGNVGTRATCTAVLRPTAAMSRTKA